MQAVHVFQIDASGASIDIDLMVTRSLSSLLGRYAVFFPLGSHLFDCRSEFGHDSELFEGRYQHGGGACAKGFHFLVICGAIQDGYCAEWSLSWHLCGPVLCFLEDFGTGDQDVVAHVLGVDLG
jgi:hypothetical protein